MRRIHTHYDNLKVSRNAPVEVIKAAYRALSQKYHPDLNPENSDAHRIMRIINASYEVLSDPDKKKRYDEFLAQLEREQASAKPHPTQQATSKKQREKRPLVLSFFLGCIGHLHTNSHHCPAAKPYNTAQQINVLSSAGLN